MRVDRIDALEEYIISHKTATLDSLCEEFDVSKNTLRRDIDTLLKRGNIKKVYGGVMATEKREAVSLKPFNERNSTNLNLKESIAEKASYLINDGDTLFIDTGSSTLPLIRFLGRKNDITIVTNSVPVIYAALSEPSLNVIALPGTLNRPTDSLVGAACLESLKNFHVKKSIMSCTGLSIENGVCNASFSEYEIKRAAMNIASERILLADHTKFGVSAMMSYSSIDRFDYLVSDSEPPKTLASYLSERGVELVV